MLGVGLGMATLVLSVLLRSHAHLHLETSLYDAGISTGYPSDTSTLWCGAILLTILLLAEGAAVYVLV